MDAYILGRTCVPLKEDFATFPVLLSLIFMDIWWLSRLRHSTRGRWTGRSWRVRRECRRRKRSLSPCRSHPPLRSNKGLATSSHSKRSNLTYRSSIFLNVDRFRVVACVLRISTALDKFVRYRLIQSGLRLETLVGSTKRCVPYVSTYCTVCYKYSCQVPILRVLTKSNLVYCYICGRIDPNSLLKEEDQYNYDNFMFKIVRFVLEVYFGNLPAQFFLFVVFQSSG